MLVRMPADLLKDSEISQDYKTSVKRKERVKPWSFYIEVLS